MGYHIYEIRCKMRSVDKIVLWYETGVRRCRLFVTQSDDVDFRQWRRRPGGGLFPFQHYWFPTRLSCVSMWAVEYIVYIVAFTEERFLWHMYSRVACRCTESISKLSAFQWHLFCNTFLYLTSPNSKSVHVDIFILIILILGIPWIQNL